MRAVQARRDRRAQGAALTLALVLAGGGWLARERGPDVGGAGSPALRPAASAQAGALAAGGRPGQPAAHPAGAAPAGSELQRRFDEAVRLLQAGHHAQAVQAWHQVLVRAPRLVEAHVNMGYALLGLARPAQARAFFDSATALQPGQANAYYGLALAWEAEGDLAMATGAMRSYLHLARDERPEHLRRARAALWEWEQARAQAGR